MHRLVALAFLAAAACGSSAKPAPPTKMTVGAFTLDVPATWKDVSKDRTKEGQVGLQHTKKPSVVLILSPAPSPMPFDPTDYAACAENGARVPGATGAGTVVTLPGGKACVVEAGTTKPMTMTVMAVGDKGVMAQCQYANAADRAVCEPLVNSLALAK
jgi:hypothetical protein